MPTRWALSRMRFLLLWLVMQATACLAQDPATVSAKELFAWYDQLGFVDVARAPFARIWTGESVMQGGGRWEHDISDGFILEDRGEVFSALLNDLTVGTFKKQGINTTEPNFCGYRLLDLKVEAEKLLRRLANPRQLKERERDAAPFYFYVRPSPEAQIFVIARECARRGFPELGERLVNALGRYPMEDEVKRGREFPKWIKEDIARAMTWEAELAFRDPAKSWADLRTLFAQIVEVCPDTPDAEGARGMVAQITRLLEAEKTRTQLPENDPEQLVWRLHEEQGEPDDHREAWPKAYGFPPRESPGVMAALRAKGKAAVPALIGELKRDARPSRTVVRPPRWAGVPVVRDTHWLALLTMNDIAGFSFYSLVDGTGMVGAIDEWWLAIQRGEEREWLLKNVREGGKRADAVADCLLARYPADFMDAAIAAIRKSSDPNLREKMIGRLAGLNDARVVPFLNEQMTAATEWGWRIACADALRHMGKNEGENYIVEEVWKMSRAEFEEAKPEAAHGLPGQAGWLFRVLDFLMRSDNPAPFEMVIDRWAELPARYRFQCVDHLWHRGAPWTGKVVSETSPAAQQVIRTLLYLALEDTSRRGGYDHRAAGSFMEPRLCDVAGIALQVHWPKEFVFDQFALESKRERQRVAILNAHYREKGRPELPMPKERPKVPREQRQVIADVKWDAKETIPNDPVRAVLKKRVGKRITGEELASALMAYVRSPRHRLQPLEVSISRDGDGTGIYIDVRQGSARAKSSGFDLSQFVHVAGETTHDSHSSGSGSIFGRPPLWEEFQAKAQAAMQSPPEKSFLVRVWILPL